MDLGKLINKHTDKALRKKDFKRAFGLIDRVETELESLLDSDRRKYRGTVYKHTVDKTIPESRKGAELEDAEISVLVGHTLIADLLDALDTVKDKWKKLEAIHTNREGY
ncbi:hypothetical protein NRE21_004229 [Salmonella enterica]|nr:hypothetical protein [Salmonella enterica]EJO2516220.1 hypothetical protein [Salmonella enterica]ELL5280667.1 hypothetical protein [Salmonella enterica]